MTTNIITRFALPIFAAAMLGLAPSAYAQTSTMGPASTMKPSSTTPMNATTPGTMKPMKPMMSEKPTTKPSMTSPASSYTSLADAQAKCSGDTVVWSTMSKSKSYHAASSKYFGKTKKGGYMCEKTATAAGYHAAKN